MNNFKVGDLLDISADSKNYKTIDKCDGPFPKQVTSIKGGFVRFNNRDSGWYAGSFVKTPNVSLIENKPRVMGKYDREIIGLCGNRVVVDVYRVLDAFNTQNPILDHLIKKALCAGLRGHKDRGQDLRDILHSAQKAVELFEQKEGK